MEKPVPEVFVVDCGPTQPFKNLVNGQKFFDSVGNLCVKVEGLDGVNAVTVEPIISTMPSTAWLIDLAPVRPARFS